MRRQKNAAFTGQTCGVSRSAVEAIGHTVYCDLARQAL
jgi:hypothetical protein